MGLGHVCWESMGTLYDCCVNFVPFDITTSDLPPSAPAQHMHPQTSRRLQLTGCYAACMVC